jgi:YesN/AraC family two-component response regulator
MIKVMIVDDEPYIRQGIQILINWVQYGFEICGEASNGKEAIELMKGMNVDLVITDIKMPEMNGIELIEYTWEHISDKIRFIILSGYYEFEYAKKAIKYDVADYILKPVQQEELIRALEDYKKQFKRWNQERGKLELSEKIVFDCYLSKDIMDDLIQAIEEYDTEKMGRKLEVVYDYFKEIVADPEIIKINLDYLLFNLVNLAKELKPEFDQEEINKIIIQSGYNQIVASGNATELKKFALVFSTYLNQLRQYALGGVLTEIEKEIIEHYMDNLSLKSLSEKYYINSAYLGQIFKKQYGISFKDYLNSYRIDRAAELLIRSDVMIYEVAIAVGFNSTDYFISKFVEFKGSTPLQYKKQVIYSIHK